MPISTYVVNIRDVGGVGVSLSFYRAFLLTSRTGIGALQRCALRLHLAVSYYGLLDYGTLCYVIVDWVISYHIMFMLYVSVQRLEARRFSMSHVSRMLPCISCVSVTVCLMCLRRCKTHARSQHISCRISQESVLGDSHAGSKTASCVQDAPLCGLSERPPPAAASSRLSSRGLAREREKLSPSSPPQTNNDDDNNNNNIDNISNSSNHNNNKQTKQVVSPSPCPRARKESTGPRRSPGHHVCYAILYDTIL